MVKEYLKEKLDTIMESKDSLVNERNRLLVIKNRLHDSIIEIQENSDIDFEIFSPRNGGYSSRGKLNEMYQQLNDIKKQIVSVSRELENVIAKENNFKFMIQEVEELERLAGR